MLTANAALKSVLAPGIGVTMQAGSRILGTAELNNNKYFQQMSRVKSAYIEKMQIANEICFYTTHTYNLQKSGS